MSAFFWKVFTTVFFLLFYFSMTSHFTERSVCQERFYNHNFCQVYLFVSLLSGFPSGSALWTKTGLKVHILDQKNIMVRQFDTQKLTSTVTFCTIVCYDELSIEVLPFTKNIALVGCRHLNHAYWCTQPKYINLSLVWTAKLQSFFTNKL